jgi:aquaporin Z
MRAMPIRIYTGNTGWLQVKASFHKNWKHYLQEALGLAIFMFSACFFGALLEAKTSPVHLAISNAFLRSIIMGILMGATALFIFYSKYTSPSGSHINPAVTITFLRLNKMCRWDALFFIIFQIVGGIIAVISMQLLMGSLLINPPVNSVATIPGPAGIWPALFTEFGIAFITMTMVLFTSHNKKLKKYTRIFSGCLVCTWVIVAGPLSGFGMNPARSLASALPANIWTAFWIYLFIPFAGMLSAAELFVFVSRLTKRIAKEKMMNQAAILLFFFCCVALLYVNNSIEHVGKLL